uniref:Mitogen-activated protein kinase kinase kinase n=1 Tax=Entomoneis paludosa TaxID=265537 RepID=A0A7S2Y8D6_9STRA|mmetsp:Transcript_22244/g.46399  ORF Transcript_22244/g.46399 Transcript_22244/m.46399 type:complete len:875 (+) Transcript_22244:351-2975(+)
MEYSPNHPVQYQTRGPAYRYAPSKQILPPHSTTFDLNGRSFLAPNSDFARAVVMGNELPGAGTNASESNRNSRASNLTVMMEQHEQYQKDGRTTQQHPLSTRQSRGVGSEDEADSACGPPRHKATLGSSAPSQNTTSVPNTGIPMAYINHRTHSAGTFDPSDTNRFRRCFSSKELGTLAPPSGSRYQNMLQQKEQLEESTRRRLQEIKATARDTVSEQSDDSTSASSKLVEGGNESRNRRRIRHNKAIVEDLCDVVADLFLSESKLLQANEYGVSGGTLDYSKRESIVSSVQDFVSALPMRYALGVETPSEVLLHMRLMAAARADGNKASVHIRNLEHDDGSYRRAAPSNSSTDKALRLVTIACRDTQGLLELITRSLASGGSRVLDADVMLSKDGTVLDRFLVEMNGRLRLDKLAQLIEEVLCERPDIEGGGSEDAKTSTRERRSSPGANGPLYFHEELSDPVRQRTPQDISREMETAVPLSQHLRSSSLELPKLRKMHSMPDPPPSFHLPMRPEPEHAAMIIQTSHQPEEAVEPVEALRGGSPPQPRSNRQRRPLVNRRAAPDLGVFESGSKCELQPLEYVNVPNTIRTSVENRAVPLIPFDELMLIETIGTGRVSTIYRAAWQRSHHQGVKVQMVALKVAMVDSQTGDTGHVDEVRREADIAARLQHPNICDLVGVAADTDCFCLAYEFCEGGSLLSLLSDPRRYYEYLPIALDVANGMAYLHSRNLIHRDLKPSNILLSTDHRAKIADFGMSVTNTGQELTGETGTYRYMAPEVISHDSYSSNADVYSFGVCLWQLITREIPFATLTPIQAAYAVAEGRRPTIPSSTPRRLREIIEACWEHDSYRRPSFTYIAMALADYAKMVRLCIFFT